MTQNLSVASTRSSKAPVAVNARPATLRSWVAASRRPVRSVGSRAAAVAYTHYRVLRAIVKIALKSSPAFVPPSQRMSTPVR